MENSTVASIIRRLDIILKNSTDAILVHDLEGNILAWNRGASKIYGYEESEALEMNIFELVPPHERDDYRNIINRVAAGEIIESCETRRVTGNRERLDILLTVTGLTDDQGNINSIATTERDITEIKEALREKINQAAHFQELLPICSSCRKIRDEEGFWHHLESCLREHSNLEFTHSICEECKEKLYTELVTESDGEIE